VVILALFTRLRQICLIPAIAKINSNIGGQKTYIDSILDEISDDMRVWLKDKYSSAWYNSPKMVTTINIIKEIIPTGEKILIFSSFRQILDMFKIQLDEVLPNVKVVQLDGSQSFEERAKSIAQFKQGNAQIFLITFKAGSQGLTLIEATHVIPMEPWWTPVVLDQAIARSHRIGQTKNVHVHNIYMKNSIETRIMQICAQKQRIISELLGEGGEQVSLKLNAETIGKMLGNFR
jgi:SNF2 family DNA or RNA helicase